MKHSHNQFRRLAVMVCLLSVLLATSVVTISAQTDAFQFGVILGGGGSERIFSLVRGPSGEFYVGGVTTSTDLPVSAGALDRTSSGGEGFVARFSASGELEWLTYLGGGGPDVVYDLALGDGALYAAGVTSSTDFPGAPPVNGESDGFVAAVSLDGTGLYYATLLGGTDQESAYALTVDGSQVVVTGISYSTDYSPSIYYGAGDAFVTMLNASGASVFVQLFGGRGVDAGFDVALQNGDIWVAGQTFSFNFPARGLKGLQDGYVMRLDANGNIKWASLVGGGGEDNVQGLALDQNGSAYVTGMTASGDFPPGDQLYGPSDTYLAQLSPEGSLTQSVRIGGTGEELGRTVSLDGSGRVLLCGFTSSGDFPVTSNAHQTRFGGGDDAFIASFDASALTSPAQFFATFFGGGGDDSCNSLAAAAGGNVFVSGVLESGAPVNFSKLGSGGGQDGYILSIAALPAGAAPIPTATQPPASGTPVVVLTPTIPLVYTPPPATAAPIMTPTQTMSTGTESTVQALTPGGETTAAATLTGSVGVQEQTETGLMTAETTSPPAEAKSTVGWWIGGIAVIMALAGGGWYFFLRKRG